MVKSDGNYSLLLYTLLLGFRSFIIMVIIHVFLELFFSYVLVT